jgi:uncharacterized protein (UPF0335 family)
MTTERCERCDREECPMIDDVTEYREAMADCYDHPAVDWRTRARDEAKRAEAAEALLSVLADEFDRAARNKLDRGGQHVPYHGDFANVGHGAALKMRRWAKEIREAIGTVTP